MFLKGMRMFMKDSDDDDYWHKVLCGLATGDARDLLVLGSHIWLEGSLPFSS
jgi:hypothetical protein